MIPSGTYVVSDVTVPSAASVNVSPLFGFVLSNVISYFVIALPPSSFGGDQLMVTGSEKPPPLFADLAADAEAAATLTV